MMYQIFTHAIPRNSRKKKYNDKQQHLKNHHKIKMRKNERKNIIKAIFFKRFLLWWRWSVSCDKGNYVRVCEPHHRLTK